MPTPRLPITLALCLCAFAAGCRGGDSGEPAVAEPHFSMDRSRVPLGSPVDMTYRFEVAPEADAVRAADHRVFVHFIDSDGELMWTDDHTPEPPTTEWKPGETVEYTRTMFVPIYPYIGDATISLGLYRPEDGRRLPLKARARGDREYEVGKLTLAPQSENIFVIYRDGWHPPESAPDQPAVEWQWTKKTGIVSFRNPKEDVTLFLKFDGRPDVFPSPQQVTLRVNDEVLQTLPVSGEEPAVHRIPISAAQLGDGDMVEMRLEADKSFVPNQIPAGSPGHGRDDRELGIRVFHLFVANR
jgi:hypothetical protein